MSCHSVKEVSMCFQNRRLAGRVVASLVLAALAAAPAVRADTLAPGYSMQNVNVVPDGQFTASGGQINHWTSVSGYQIYNTSSGSTTTIGLPPNGTITNYYGDAFGVYDPANNVFYAGTNANNGSYIYEYNGTTGAWSNSSSAGVYFPDAYGAQVHNGQLYVSGGPSTTASLVVYGPNAIVNNSPPQTLGQVAGYSGFLAVAPDGDLYLAPSDYYYNFSETDTLYRWTASQVANAGVTPLTTANAAQTVVLPGNGNGLAVDAAGNVFFAVNDQYTGVSTLGLLDSAPPAATTRSTPAVITLLTGTIFSARSPWTETSKRAERCTLSPVTGTTWRPSRPFRSRARWCCWPPRRPRCW